MAFLKQRRNKKFERLFRNNTYVIDEMSQQRILRDFPRKEYFFAFFSSRGGPSKGSLVVFIGLRSPCKFGRRVWRRRFDWVEWWRLDWWRCNVHGPDGKRPVHDYGAVHSRRVNGAESAVLGFIWDAVDLDRSHTGERLAAAEPRECECKSWPKFAGMHDDKHDINVPGHGASACRYR